MEGEFTLKQQALIAEYGQLRQEMMTFGQSGIQAVGVGIPIAAGFIVFGFQLHSSIAFLCVIASLGACLWFAMRQYGHVIWVGAYIFTVIEPQVSGLQWEHLVAAERGGKSIGGFTYRLIVPAVYTTANITASVLAWSYLPNHDATTIEVFGLATGILLLFAVAGVLHAYRVTSDRFYRTSCARWSRAMKQMDAVV
jgi:hypothetical protein